MFNTVSPSENQHCVSLKPEFRNISFWKGQDLYLNFDPRNLIPVLAHSHSKIAVALQHVVYSFCTHCMQTSTVGSISFRVVWICIQLKKNNYNKWPVSNTATSSHSNSLHLMLWNCWPVYLDLSHLVIAANVNTVDVAFLQEHVHICAVFNDVNIHQKATSQISVKLGVNLIIWERDNSSVFGDERTFVWT